MNKNSIGRIAAMAPFGVSLVSVYLRSVWLAVAAVILIFILVSVLPFCHKHENLWIFIMTAFLSVPMNLSLLKQYDIWMIFSTAERDGGWIYYMTLAQYVLILSSIEEIIAGMIGRLIWRRQYKLFLPVEEEEEA